MKKDMYTTLKEENAVRVAKIVSNIIGLEPDPETGLLKMNDIVDTNDEFPADFTFGGYTYVEMNGPFVHRVEEDPDSIKVFDPYNDTDLMRHCLFIQMMYKGIAMDDDVMVEISNIELNEPGVPIVKIVEDCEDKIESIEEFCKDYLKEAEGYKGDIKYSKDSMKYLDLMYRLELVRTHKIESLMKGLDESK